MKIEKLNEWLGFSANVGVIIGIVFLILELQQTNRIAAVSSEFEIRSQFAPINELWLTDTEFGEFVLRITTQEEPLSPLDRERARSWIYQFLNVWLAGTFAYENGAASEVLYYNMLDNACMVVGFAGPYFKGIWREELDNFPSLAETNLWVHIYGILDGSNEYCQ